MLPGRRSGTYRLDLNEHPNDLLGNPVNSAQLIGFAENPALPGGAQDWLRSVPGGLNATDPPSVNADLYQDVPGTPGMKYILTGWSRFETYYSAAWITSIWRARTTCRRMMGHPHRPIRSLRLIFWVRWMALLSTVSVELRADGQLNGGNEVWDDHMVMGVRRSAQWRCGPVRRWSTAILIPGISASRPFSTTLR